MYKLQIYILGVGSESKIKWMTFWKLQDGYLILSKDSFPYAQHIGLLYKTQNNTNDNNPKSRAHRGHCG